MNTLNIQKVSDLKKAFNLNLTISGIDEREILWLGNHKNIQKFLEEANK